MLQLQQVYVTTVEGTPTFFVYEIARDKFIDEVIAGKFGKQDDGARHEWEAFPVERVKTEAAQSCIPLK